MKKIVSLIVVMSFFTSSCAVHPIKNLAFKDRPVFVSEPQTKDYEELGRVGIKTSGFIWDSCEDIAMEGIDIVLRNAQNMGGNAVVRLQISECKTQYGWFILYILPGLGPWVRNVSVEGVAVKRLPSSQKQ